jgi:two-component system cell cycle response regulator
MESGADDYLTKPFDQHELQVRLRPGLRIIQLQHELITAREELRDQATKDFLTSIWNRSSILDIFNRELQRGVREGRPVGLVLADLDHFKSVNDTYGHFAGDAVLREFVTEKQAERMREALANEPMWFNDESKLITCSFGATAWVPGIEPAEEALIRVADDALYRAKRQGRNRVVFLPASKLPADPVAAGMQESGGK